MCRKNCKWDVWGGGGGKASIWGATAPPPLSQCSYVPDLISFRVTHYVILKVILYAFYELNGGELMFLPFHSYAYKMAFNIVILNAIMRDAKLFEIY